MRKWLHGAVIILFGALPAVAQVGLPWPGPGGVAGGGGGSSSGPFTLVVAAGTNGTSPTGQVNTTGSTCFVATVSGYNPGGLTGHPTDSASNTWTAAPDNDASTTSDTQVGMWYVANPTTSATHTFTYDNGGTSNYDVLSILAFSSSAGCVLDTHSAANNANQPGALTPSANNTVLVSGFVAKDADTGTPTVNSSFVIGTNNALAYASGSNEGGGQGYLILATAASKNPTWSTSGGQTGASMMVVFK